MGVHFSLERGTWALFLILEARYVKPSLAFQPQRMWERVPGEQQPVELVPFQRVGAVPGASGPDLVHCELRLDRDLGKWPSALTMPVCSSGCAQQLARQPEGSFEASSLSLSASASFAGRGRAAATPSTTACKKPTSLGTPITCTA